MFIINWLKKRWWLALIVLSICFYIVYTWAIKTTPTQENLCREGFLLYKNLTYDGVAIKKNYDESKGYHKSVVLEQGNGERKMIYLEPDTSGIYEFISIGDSLIKKQDELSVQLIRKNLDTTLYYKFRCR